MVNILIYLFIYLYVYFIYLYIYVLMYLFTVLTDWMAVTQRREKNSSSAPINFEASEVFATDNTKSAATNFDISTLK